MCRGGDTIGAQQTCVHLFLSKRRLPPAEIAHRFSALREGLPRPKPGHAGQRIGVPRRPIHRTGLLLHDPSAAPVDGAVKVMVDVLIIGFALPDEAQTVLGVDGARFDRKLSG